MSQTLSSSLARCYGLARVARVWKPRAPASIALARRRRRIRSPVALVRSAHVRTRNWPTISAGTSPPPAFTARATASYGRDCALRAFARAPAVCDG